MLLRGASKVRAAGKRRTTRPDNRLSALNAGREQLIFEISVQHARLLDELDHPTPLGHVPGQRFLTRDSNEIGASRSSVDNLLHVLKSRVIGPAHPYAVDRGIGNHVRYRGIRLCLSHVEGASKRNSLIGPTTR